MQSQEDVPSICPRDLHQEYQCQHCISLAEDQNCFLQPECKHIFTILMGTTNVTKDNVAHKYIMLIKINFYELTSKNFAQNMLDGRMNSFRNKNL